MELDIDLVGIFSQCLELMYDSIMQCLEAALTPGVVIPLTILALIIGIRFFVNIVSGTDSTAIDESAYGRNELFFDEAEDIMDDYRYEMDILDAGGDLDNLDSEYENEYYRRWAHDDG